MEKRLTGKEYIIEDASFDRLLRNDVQLENLGEARYLDREAALNHLRSDKRLAAMLLNAARKEIVYMGELGGYASRLDSESGTLGMKRSRGTDVVTLSGDNLAGRFLTSLAEQLRRELEQGEGLQERVSSRSRVIVDWNHPDEYSSDIEQREEDGRRYIHVDSYKSRTWKDADRRGATGYAQRKTDDDVRFHTFECPFGTDRRSGIRVESEAQASLLYEKAIRGEIDWHKMLRDRREDGSMRRMTDSELKAAADDYRAQFEWVREQIATRSEDLSHLPIVSPSLLAGDMSMGRSIHDAEHAPSPAHVLEHYIDNPHLLSGISESYVERALNNAERMETDSVPDGDADVVTIAIVGSDTIGGRRPGTRTTRSSVRTYSMDAGTGAMRDTGSRKEINVDRKDREEIEADYAALSSRLDGILSGLGEKKRVRLVMANHGGAPRLVERYVREHGGRNSDWDIVAGFARERSGDGDSHLESVAMKTEHFNQCWGVLCGYEEKTEFRLDKMDEDSVRVFRSDDLRCDAAVVLSVSEDQYNMGILEKGSLAAAAGLPVIHVMDNMTEDEQKRSLEASRVITLEENGLDEDLGESLFKGQEQNRWDLGASVITSGSIAGVVLPIVMQHNNVSVRVGGIPYDTVFGAFTALQAQEAGEADVTMLRRIASAERVQDASERLVALLGIHGEIARRSDSAAEERAMRRAVHLFARTDGRFEDMLMNLHGKTVVEQCSIQDGRLFVNAEGVGHNRFGVVLSHEAARIASHREAVRRTQVETMMASLEREKRRQKARTAKRAEGQLVKGGLPSIADSQNAVWFTGTAKPLELQTQYKTFDVWKSMKDGKNDPLNREMAQRAFFGQGEGRFPNPYVYVAATNLLTAMGKTKPSLKADGQDLTGCSRIDPKTGEEFVCGFGITVRKDAKNNEEENAFGEPCSYLLERDFQILRNSIILTDTQARAAAITHGLLGVCIEGYEHPDKSLSYNLTTEFRHKIKTLPKDDGILRDPKTGERVYLKDTAEVSFATGHQAVVHRKSDDDAIARALEHKKALEASRKKVWIVNPHEVPVNRELMERYIQTMHSGELLPLNCVPMRLDSYVIPKDADKAARIESEFVLDLNLSFDMANSLAIAMGVPLRFPLAEDGKIDLGPNVDERLRDIAQRKVEAFLGIREEKSLDGVLPKVDRMNMLKAKNYSVTATGDTYFHANDLVYAFGEYDFESVRARKQAPMHEMAFSFEDGSVLRLTELRFPVSMKTEDVNGYLAYTKDDEIKFNVASSDPGKVDWQLAVIRSYVERVKTIRPRWEIFEEGAMETRDLGLEGYIDLKSSNSLERASHEWEMDGREQKPWEMQSRFDGVDGGQVYYGHVDAGDGFKGYAMMSYEFPDGTQSEWQVVKDRELAKQIVFTKVGRVYRTDEFVPASPRVIDMMVIAQAAKDPRIRDMKTAPRQQKPAEDKVVEIERTAPKVRREAPETAEKVNVYAGRGENAGLSNFAERRFKVDMNKFTKRHGIK